MVTFKEITKFNVDHVIELKVFDHQEDQVAQNIESIVEGTYHEEAWFRAIYSGEILVGFVMLEIDNDKKHYAVWRFMIDKNCQGKGYGRASMDLIKKVMKEMVPDIREIYLSYVSKERRGADEFYTKVGFEDTGEMLGEEKVMCYKY